MKYTAAKKEREMDYYSTIKTCRLCDSNKIKEVVDLGSLPVASPNVGGNNSQESQILAPVIVCKCEDCGFLQLSVVVNPEYQYKNFLYKTNLSLGLIQHFDNLMDMLDADQSLKDRFVFDVGSNDGSLLDLAKKRGAKVLGIDPAIRTAEEATSRGILTYGDFFTEKKAKEILKEHGKMDIIISNNTIANIANLKDIFLGFKHLLNSNGLLVIETQYSLDVLEKKLIDVIYHEHISYFSVAPMQKFLESIGFQLIDAQRIAPKGGSIRFIAQPSEGIRPINKHVSELIQLEEQSGLYREKIFEKFNSDIKKIGEEVRKQLLISKDKNGVVYAYGSSVGCSAMLHYFSLGDIIDAVFDDAPLSSSLNVNGSYLPIHHGADLIDYPPTDVVVLAWRYIDFIRDKQKNYISKGGSFFSVLKT